MSSSPGVTQEARLEIGDDANALAWDAFVHAHPHATADHLYGWRRVIDDVFGHRSAYLTARRDGNVTGVLPLVCFRSRLFGRCVVSLPFLNYGGVLASDPLTTTALMHAGGDIARAFGASHLEFRHVERRAPELPFRQHKLSLVRPLPRSSEALWNGLDRKVRNQVRKAQKEGLTVDAGGAELIDEFYAVFARNMRDLGTPVYSKRLFASVLEVFPERTRVHVVRGGGRTMAASIVVTFRDTALVPWASSLREYRDLCPNMLLYWAMMEHAIGSGLGMFDFGRSSQNSGPHHFKVQWGAEATPMHWEYELFGRSAPPDQGPANPSFEAAIEAWKRLPLWLANALGPQVVRNIP